MRVAILLFDGVEELDAVGVYEVLAKAKQLHPQLDLTVRTRALKEDVTGALGLRILAHEVKRDFSDVDLLIVPGGPGRSSVVRDLRLLEDLARFATRKPIASVATGAFILRQAGLLHGSPEPTEPTADPGAGVEPDEIPERITEDGDVTTAGGVTASLDLGLHLLAKYFDQRLADEVVYRIEIPARP